MSCDILNLLFSHLQCQTICRCVVDHCLVFDFVSAPAAMGLIFYCLLVYMRRLCVAVGHRFEQTYIIYLYQCFKCKQQHACVVRPIVSTKYVHT